MVEAAKEYGINLIVTGTRGCTGLEWIVFGLVAEQVVKRAPCPVLTVCPVAAERAERPAAFRRILAAVDFSQHSLWRTLRAMGEALCRSG